MKILGSWAEGGGGKQISKLRKLHIQFLLYFPYYVYIYAGKTGGGGNEKIGF